MNAWNIVKLKREKKPPSITPGSVPAMEVEGAGHLNYFVLRIITDIIQNACSKFGGAG